jgi:uncharacterized protein YeaO (DUF488 family)
MLCYDTTLCVSDSKATPLEEKPFTHMIHIQPPVFVDSMLKESYISQWRNLPADAIKVRVARPSILSASKDLLTAYKSGRITWEAFQIRFRKEIQSNPKAIAELYRLKDLSKTNDVYLICYEKTSPCHRFILLDMIQNLPEKE